jgi:hypothetical protein
MEYLLNDALKASVSTASDKNDRYEIEHNPAKTATDRDPYVQIVELRSGLCAVHYVQSDGCVLDISFASATWPHIFEVASAYATSVGALVHLFEPRLGGA